MPWECLARNSASLDATEAGETGARGDELSGAGLTEATARSCMDVAVSQTDGPKSGRQDGKLGRAETDWPKRNDAS